WLGYTASEIVGRRRVFELLHPDDRKDFVPGFAAFQAKGTLTRDVVYLRKDGTALYGVLHARATYDDDRRFRAGRSVVVESAERLQREVLQELAQRHGEEVRELRERCGAESARADRAEAGLAKRDAEQDLLLASTALGIWHWDLWTGKITRRGPIEQIFGLAPEAYKGSMEGMLAAVHPDDRLEFRRAIERAREQQELYEHEFRVVTADGSSRWP